MKHISLLCCEKVITDTSGQITLIGIIQGITAKITPLVETPANAVAPTSWIVFAVWQTDSDEAGLEFTQIFQILWPDGSEFAKTPIKFKSVNMRKATIYGTVQGLPIGQKGNLVVRSWVEDKSGKVTEIIEYKILVEHEITVPPVPPVPEIASA